MAELVDARGLGPRARKGLQVQILPRARKKWMRDMEKDKRLKRKDSHSDFLLPKDKKTLKALAKNKQEYLREIEEIDNKIVLIQDSTKTLIPQFAPLHHFFRQKSKWYYNWHLKPNASKIHWSALVVYVVIFIVSAIYGMMGNPYKPIIAAGLSCTSVDDGLWSSPSTWSNCGGGVPGIDDNVTISSNTIVQLNGAVNIGNGNISISGILTTGSYTLTLNDMTINSGGTLEAFASTINVSGSWSNSGTFNAGTSTVSFIGTTTGKTIKSGSSSFSTLVINGSGGEWTLVDNLSTGTLNVSAGTLKTGSLNLSVNQTATLSGGNLTGGTGTMLFGNLVVSHSLSTFVASRAVEISSGGTYTRSAGNADWLSNVSSLYLRGATQTLPVDNYFNLRLGGSTSGITYTLGNGNTIINGDLAIDYSNNPTLVVGNQTLTVLGNISIGFLGSASGLISVTAGTIYVGGDWTKYDKAFVGFSPGTGTVILITNKTSTISGSTNFYNLTIDASSEAKTVRFAAGSTQTISGTLTLKGAPGKILTLARYGGVTGSRWNLSVPSSINVGGYLNVSDSAASRTITTGPASIDGGNNVNWQFNNNPPSTTATTNPSSPNGDNGYFIGNAPTIILSATETDGGTVSATYYRWGSSGNYSLYSTPIVAPEGLNTLYYYSVDNVGNTETVQTSNYKVDLTPPMDPILALNNQTDGSDIYTHDRTVNVTISQDSEAAKWLLSETQMSRPNRDNSLFSNKPKSFTLSSGDGNKIVYLWVKDIAGNVNQKQVSATILLHTTPPTVPGRPIQRSPTNSRIVTFDWAESLDKSGLGLKGYQVYIGTSNGQADIIDGELAPSNSYTKEFSQDGTYYIQVAGLDNTGLLSQKSESGVAMVNTAALPKVSSKAPSNPLETLQKSPIAQKIAKTATPIVTATAALGLLPLIAQAIPQAFHVFASVFPMLFTAAVARRKRKPWGIVFDSLTGKPIDFAIVRAFEAETGQLVQTKVTDENGRFNLLLSRGNYYVKVSKPGFVFPARIPKLKATQLTTRFGPEADIYLGQAFTIKNDDTNINLNIPLDPILSGSSLKLKARLWFKNAFDWFLISLSYASFPLLIIGAFLAALATLITESNLNIFISAFYIVLLSVYLVARRIQKVKLGFVFDSKTGQPIPKAVISIFDKEYRGIKDVKVTDSHGHFSVLLQKGQYYLTVSAKGYRFPSKIAQGDYYFGKTINIKRPAFLNVSIPLDKD